MPMGPEVYFRLFIRLNQNTFPLPIITLLIACVLAWLILKGKQRWSLALLGIAWIWVGYYFHLHLFSELNWIAVYFAWIFILQGIVYVILGISQSGDFDIPLQGKSFVISVVFIVLGAVIYPILTGLIGESWQGAQLFGMAPNPTVIVTLAIIPVSSRTTGWLSVVPLMWCVIGAAIDYAMQQYTALILPVIGLIFIGSIIYNRKHQKNSIE